MAIILSAFPGTGKTFYANNFGDKEVYDPDSSSFSKLFDGSLNPEFPNNYVAYLMEIINDYKVIFVSTNIEVRKALKKLGVNYVLVYPKRELKQEYLERYKSRGSPKAFLNKLNDGWDLWVSDMEEEGDCKRIVLSEGEFISDYIEEIKRD